MTSLWKFVFLAYAFQVASSVPTSHDTSPHKLLSTRDDDYDDIVEKAKNSGFLAPFKVGDDSYDNLSPLQFQGGSSVVMRARQNGDDEKLVAVKVCQGNRRPEACKEEARIMKKLGEDLQDTDLGGDKIPEILGVSTEDIKGQPSTRIVMELGHGPALTEATLDGKAPSAKDRKNLFWRLFRLLAAVHKADVAHGDLKSDNFIFAKPVDEGIEQVPLWLLDFGFALEGLARMTHHRGTDDFAAPGKCNGFLGQISSVRFLTFIK
jgi:serine/threonine protein kinase